jgi:hypothetical protein
VSGNPGVVSLDRGNSIAAVDCDLLPLPCPLRVEVSTLSVHVAIAVAAKTAALSGPRDAVVAIAGGPE